MTAIVNPFNLNKKVQLESTSSAEMQSTSSVCNEVHGQCPKCFAPMDTVSIGYAQSSNSEPVFWCNTCRVATPKPIN